MLGFRVVAGLPWIVKYINIYIYIYNCKKEKLFSKLIYGDHLKKNVEHSSLKNNLSLTKISVMLYP